MSLCMQLIIVHVIVFLCSLYTPISQPIGKEKEVTTLISRFYHEDLFR